MAFSRAQILRSNPSEAEKALWRRLRRRQLEGFRFRRQQPIGPFVVDFFCPEARIVVEFDGGQHSLWADEDAERTAWLESSDYRVVRYWKNEVLGNIEGVLSGLRVQLADR